MLNSKSLVTAIRQSSITLDKQEPVIYNGGDTSPYASVLAFGYTCTLGGVLLIKGDWVANKDFKSLDVEYLNAKGDEGALNQKDNRIYRCEACLYTFPAEEEVTQYPDCGKFTVRLAAKQEQ